MGNCFPMLSNQNSEKKRREKAIQQGIDILVKQKVYKFLNFLGSGTFGDVVKMHDSNKKIDIAVKIVTSDNIVENELKIWPRLSHPNIVPLLGIYNMKPLHDIMFVMPVHPKSLQDILLHPHFKKWTGCLSSLKGWLHDVLCGLDYMHSKNLCHLDIKSDNVLVSSTHTAMLCDFTYLNYFTNALTRDHAGLPYLFRPPENFTSMRCNKEIDGVSFDMWAYGIMALELFTNFALSYSICNVELWFEEIYPKLFDILQKNNFQKTVVQNLQGAHMNSEETNLTLNFIHAFLRFHCKQRITAKEAMHHAFLRKGNVVGPGPDPPWIIKSSLQSIGNIVKFGKQFVDEIPMKCINITEIKQQTSKVRCKSAVTKSEDYNDQERGDIYRKSNSNIVDINNSYNADENNLKYNDQGDRLTAEAIINHTLTNTETGWSNNSLIKAISLKLEHVGDISKKVKKIEFEKISHSPIKKMPNFYFLKYNGIEVPYMKKMPTQTAIHYPQNFCKREKMKASAF